MCILINLRKANEKHLREMTQSMTELNREKEKKEGTGTGGGGEKKRESPGPCSSTTDPTLHTIQALLPERNAKGSRVEKAEKVEKSKKTTKAQQANASNGNSLGFSLPSSLMNMGMNLGTNGSIGSALLNEMMAAQNAGVSSMMNMNMNMNVPLPFEQYGLGIFGNAGRNNMFGFNSFQMSNNSPSMNNNFGTISSFDACYS